MKELGGGNRSVSRTGPAPATRGSKKASDRAITPVAEAVRVCALGTARVPATQAAVPHSHSTLTGAELPQAKKQSCIYACRVASVMSNSVTLWTVSCHASLSGGVLQARILECIGQYWLPYPSRALYFLLP